jgi:hypothetical protein
MAVLKQFINALDAVHRRDEGLEALQQSHIASILGLYASLWISTGSRQLGAARC